MFSTFDEIRSAGFEGFVTIAALKANPHLPPDRMGVYLVLAPDRYAAEFLPKGSGGHYRRNPNRPMDVIKTHWVNGAIVLNIGKAGKIVGDVTLRGRLRAYMRFGSGENVSHYGGRHIWQLANSDDLLICWKATEEEPREVERRLIAAFKAHYGVRPFANLQD